MKAGNPREQLSTGPVPDRLTPTSADISAIRQSEQCPYLKIHIVEVYVRDHDASLAFYHDRLGFEVVVDTGPQDWGRWVAVAPPTQETAVLALVEATESVQASMIGRRTGVTLVTDDIHKKVEEWSGRGVRFPHPPEPVPWGVHASFEDIDGNEFGLIQNPKMVEILNSHRRAVEDRREVERRAVFEADIARKVQARLFPQEFPPMKTLECATACIPAGHVGGDYYDLLDLCPGRIGLVLADVAGKGVSGALMVANLQASLRTQCAGAVENLRGFLSSVNRLFYRNTEESSYATLFFGDYNDTTRRLRYANCGHVSPLLLSANSTPTNARQSDVQRLLPTCTVVGLFDDWDCQTTEVALAPGDILVLYSDGVVENERADGEQFGEARLAEVVQRHAGSGADNLVSAILDATLQFSGGGQQDDVTLVVARSLH